MTPKEVIWDPPVAADLVQRVAEFLDRELYGRLPEERLNYRVRVAANLLHLVGRELRATPEVVDSSGRVSTRAIQDRYGTLADLSQALARGEASILDPDIFEALFRHTQSRAEVAESRRSRGGS